MKSKFTQLHLEKQAKEGRRISLAQVARDTELPDYTIYAFANNTLKEWPGDAIVKICDYFGCDVGQLLVIEEGEKRAKRGGNPA